MIIWGSGGGASVVGLANAEHVCPVCDKRSRHSIEVHYRYAHIWYLLSWLTSREYLDVCAICKNGVPLDKARTREAYPKDNIPFIRKKGWLLCLGLLAVLFAFGAYANSRQSDQVKGFIFSPMVNDIYLADLSEIAGSGYTPDSSADNAKKSAYGLMKLMEIEEDDLYFATSASAYSRKKDLRKVSQSDYGNIEFGVDDIVVLSKDEVLSLHEKGVIFDAVRLR